MAVTKIWAIHDSVSRVVDYCANPDKTKLSDLEQVLIYAANKAKTLDENEQQYAVIGINCSVDTIFEDNPKLRELLKCEFDARLENDPYLSTNEKKAIRGQATQKEEKQYER
jgi:hypothetical protein